MRLGRTDPGDCLVCGAAHCSCGGAGPIEVVQLPARDAARALSALSLGTPTTPVGEMEAGGSASLGDGSDGRSFSTATYRGTRRKR